jgi:hypothetical protein
MRVADGRIKKEKPLQSNSPGSFVCIACCSNIADPVKKTLGKGKLEKRNMMQMLHSDCDLQESTLFGKFKLVMLEAALWVQQKQNGNSGTDPKMQDFLMNAWARVNEFALPCDDLAKLLEKVQKTPQPVLTRWWCVGVAAAFFTSNCWTVLCATQTRANTNDADSRPNRIASGLQSLMKEDVSGSISPRLAHGTFRMAPRH